MTDATTTLTPGRARRGSLPLVLVRLEGAALLAGVLAEQVVDQPAARAFRLHEAQEIAALPRRHMMGNQARQDDVPSLFAEIAVVAGDQPGAASDPGRGDGGALGVEGNADKIERYAPRPAPACNPREHVAGPESDVENAPGF